MLEEGGTTYNTTAVNESSVRKIKPPRVLFAVLIGLTFCLMVGASWVSRNQQEALAALELKDLPIPAELVLRVAAFLVTPLGIAISIFSVVTLTLLTLKGLLDRFLKLLVGLNVAWLIVFILATAVTWSSLIGIAGPLRKGP